MSVSSFSRRLLAALSILSLSILTAVPALAAEVAFDGKISVALGTNTVEITETGIATINGTGPASPAASVTQLEVDAGNFVTTGFLVAVTDPGAFPIVSIQATLSNQQGLFTGPGPGVVSGFNGQMQIQGVNKICLFSPCSAPPPANVTVPVSVIGVGGSVTASVLVNVTAEGAPWTTGVVSITGAAPANCENDKIVEKAVGGRGVIRGIEATQDGCANDVTTPTMSQPSALRLVTPVFVSTNIGTSAVVPTFGALDLIYQAPEPGQVLLAGAAVGALILLGRSKRGS